SPALPALAIANAVAANTPATLPAIDNSNTNRLRVSGPAFAIDFDKSTGYLCGYKAGGVSMLENGEAITPNFWRAGTDNDFGADVNNKWATWRNPLIKLTSLDATMRDGLAVVTADYDMPTVKASLRMTYTINNEGAVLLTQTMTATKGADVPEMFRFGLEIPMPDDMDISTYYGRGPIENYADRNNAAFIGLYTQTASEQAYPYIRPQETGTKSDMRWWRQANRGNRGLMVTSDKPFFASATHYTTQSLDDGDRKHQRHFPEIDPVDYTILRIDGEHVGVGGVDSWSERGLALPQYRVPYGDHSMSVLLTPSK
nr:beta-galactosidase [Muribaculaceae bacterium]